MGHRSFWPLAGLVVLFLGFQNCSGVGFSTSADLRSLEAAESPAAGSEASGSVLAIGGSGSFPGQVNVNGLSGGHFDVDTATRIYPPSLGKTNHHVHEYDKKYQTTTLDFFNLIDPDFDEIHEAIPAGRRFVLNVLNADLSPGGVLEINGRIVNVRVFQRGEVFVIGGTSSASESGLRSFRLGFSPQVLANLGLVPTATDCVRANDPGIEGQYRNGALTLQALDADSYRLDPFTGAATAGLLWEATVFWHRDDRCYL